MADVLSQSEIDALLSALSTGSLEPDELQKKKKNIRLKYMILGVHKSFQKIILEL